MCGLISSLALGWPWPWVVKYYVKWPVVVVYIARAHPNPPLFPRSWSFVGLNSAIHLCSISYFERSTSPFLLHLPQTKEGALALSARTFKVTSRTFPKTPQVLRTAASIGCQAPRALCWTTSATLSLLFHLPLTTPVNQTDRHFDASSSSSGFVVFPLFANFRESRRLVN